MANSEIEIPITTSDAFAESRNKDKDSQEAETELAMKTDKASPDHDVESNESDYSPVEKQVQKTYPLREVSIKLPFCRGAGELRFNPVSSFIGFVILWGLTIYCMADPIGAKALLSQWFSDMSRYFTWLFIVANPVLCGFIIWLAFRYGDIKLGEKDAEPEFSDASYFAMIFSAGIGVGLFFYGVSEPLWHQASHYYVNAGYHSQNEVDQWALIITLYHWGFAGWSIYLTVAIATGLAAYRFGLPMTVRSTFYPLLGEYTWGWIGDIIDGYSIVMTVCGVCTSLGLGTLQIASGMERVGMISDDKSADELQNIYVSIIWVVTLAATVSVVSGVSVGIKILSNIAFWIGCLILFLCFAMEKTYYLFNVVVQTTGMYLQWCLFQMPFWTDAFGSLEPGEGRAVDDKSAETWWMGSWSVFYMAWWVSWGCFVGMFVARISKNRTLRQVIVSVFITPTIYSILWFSIFGGIGLRQQRQSLELQKIGQDYYNNQDYFKVDGDNFCYNVPQSDLIVNGTSVFTNTLPGITPVCGFDSSENSKSWFNVMYSFSYPDKNNFGGFGPFMTYLSLIALAIYFVTSSDSGSLVVDTLSSNGRSEHHWLQRVFWSFTEGGLATGLLMAGGEDALKALQTLAMVFSLPFNIFLFLMCKSIVTMCSTIEANPLDTNDAVNILPQKTWTMPIYGGVFNVFEFIFSFGVVHEERKSRGMNLPSFEQVIDFSKALFVPFVPLYSILCTVDPKKKHPLWNKFLAVTYAIFFLASIGLWATGVINNGFVALGWGTFFIMASLLTYVRQGIRKKLGIDGNTIGDLFASSFLYPQALSQMVLQLEKEHNTNIHED